MKIKNILTPKFFIIFIVCFSKQVFGQKMAYQGKLETSYLFYQNHLVKYDIAEGQYPDILNENSFEIATAHGVKINNTLGIGLGLCYLKGNKNYLGWYFDFDATLSENICSPIVGLTLGNDFKLNAANSGSFRADLSGGIAVKLYNRKYLTLKSGIALRRESSFIPLKLGLTF